MTHYLAIETATDVCSVAVLSGDIVVFEHTLTARRSHSEHLVVMIQQALTYAGIKVKDLSGIAVSKGPGSYTGLRIGVSVAKGLAFSHNISLIGVPSLDALATGALPCAEPGAPIIAAFNSRRNEVYLGLFEAGEQAVVPLAPVTSLQKDEIGPFIAAHSRGDKSPLIVGEGAAFVAACLSSAMSEGSVDEDAGDNTPVIVPIPMLLPSASVVATMGAARHKTGLQDDTGSFEPYYLNAFIPKARKKSIFDRLPF
ncbi:MAG: tRNA (adenosine(37)-N6)-threonylcarbamoyltransferase complex dimerization subunit type 1 TsaB [Bacteroidota bacterium]